MFKAIVLSCGLVAASAGVLAGCASPSDVSQAAEGAAQEAATTAENASSNVASEVADWCNRPSAPSVHRPSANTRLRGEFRRDVRRDERRDVRRDAARVAERRVDNRLGWWQRARAWWRG
jgi:hypothetical protein